MFRNKIVELNEEDEEEEQFVEVMFFLNFVSSLSIRCFVFL